MARLKRINLGLLVASVASLTLDASHRSAGARLFRRIVAPGSQVIAFQSSERDSLAMIAKDYGLDLTPLGSWAFRIADIQGLLLVPAIVTFFLLGLGVALAPLLLRSKLDKD